MVVYVVAQMTIHDPSTYLKYTSVSHKSVTRHGGKYLTRGEPLSVLEGDAPEQRMVILEFPDEEAARKAFSDPEYVEAAGFRRQASKGYMVMQKGSERGENPDPHV
ncbi:DUF1330-domain-containing protein [Aaosphaeria arxii CBS 175.79]|uniref:DUF1330-domain-containing protein n=1 Tax=Aaosphaeria arxii CBS 175.79 TaxID=1450172 RepID=A0A6A5XU75_9PLEO|nr:DUF1330-domain-containing protein [Aaosphaeria arxii CBS 175.79]KAF2016868.1 DUF1330-domain-containing protein [Aaosphaeria arxii CBS 175.79]